MAAKNIGATITLKDGGFKSGIKSAVTGLNNFKKNSDVATSSVKKFSSQTNSAGTSLASMAKKAVGVVAAYASIKQLVTWGKECVVAANAQATAEKRLETTMMNVKGVTMQNVNTMKKYAAELQGVTTVGDEVTIQGASQLATFQLQSDTIKTILPALQDLAVSQYGVAVSGDQMQSMANLVGKVMTGNVGALTRYGVTLNDAQSKILKTGTESERAAMLVEVLGQNFGGLAEAMANTPEGKVQQLKNAWGDMQEVIGTKLYPIVTTVLQYITTKLPAIQSAFTTAVNTVMPVIQGVANVATTFIDTVWNGVQNSIKPAFDNLVTAIQPVWDGLVGMGESISWTGILTTALDGIGTGLNMVSSLTAAVINNWGILSPIIYGVAGAVAAYKIAVVACDAAEKISLVTSKAKQAIMLAQGPIMAAYTSAHWALSAGYGPVTAAQWAFNAAVSANPVGVAVVAIGALIAVGVALWKNWDSVSKFFVNCWSGIKTAFTAGVNWIKTNIKSIVLFIINPFAGVFNYLYTNFEGFRTFIDGIVISVKTSFQGLWNGIVSVFSGVASWFGGIFSSAWNMVVNAFSGVVGFFQGIWNTIKNMFTSIGTSIADGISGAFKAVVNSVISFAGNIINGFINSINWAIGVINKIPGVNITKLQTVNLPMLANGGNITRPGDVIVGERGPEMLHLPKGASVEPLDRKGGGNTINLTLNIDGTGKDLKSLGRDIVNTIVPELKLALSVL